MIYIKSLKNKILVLAVIFLAVGCSIEEQTPAAGSDDGQKVKFSLTADFPESCPESKVTLDRSGLTWTGNETATLIFGKDGANNSNNPNLPSVAPGVFEGEITIPSGFTIENLRGIVVPGENGANFRGDVAATPARIRMYNAYAQTQSTNGTLNTKHLSLFAELSYSELVKDADNKYTLPSGKRLNSGSDLINFTIYGIHPEMEDGEIFKSLRIDSDKVLANRCEYAIGSGSRYYYANGETYVSVQLTEEVGFSQDKENGIKVYLSVLASLERAINKITIKTDKATYVKNISQTLDRSEIARLRVYPVSVNMANGFTRSTDISYSTDGGNTWSTSLPSESYSTLDVRTGNGNKLTESTLKEIALSMDSQDSPVDLNLKEAEYEATIFPAVFKGTETAKCTSIKSIKFPSNVNEIAENAFAYCSSLESVDFTGISTINTKAFYWSGLKTLDIPRTVTSMPGYLTFGCCINLTDVYFDSPAPRIGAAGEGGTNHAHFAYAKLTSATGKPTDYLPVEDWPELHPTKDPKCTITFGPNAAALGRYMFLYNKNIGKIVIQGNIGNNIGNYAFRQIQNLHTLDCRLAPTPLSGTATVSNYYDKLGTRAISNGVECKILVPKGQIDTYKTLQPFKVLISNGFTISEGDAEQAEISNLRIGTYNVRQQNDDDGVNNWPTRKPIFLQSVKNVGFDIFGLQEAQTYHQDYLRQELGDVYDFEYFCPSNGTTQSSNGIAWRKSDWAMVKKNTYWISPTPDVRGAYDNKGDDKHYRGSLCITFVNKKNGARIFVTCTHGCLHQEPNETYAYLYPEQEARFNPEGLPSFLVGDFNAMPDWSSSASYREYWNDTFLTIDPSLREGCEFTYCGWTHPQGKTGYRIDYIYYRGAGITPTYYKCDNTQYDGKFPSDHWPVYADFTIAPVK